jgi:hypothetical protein
MISIAAIPLKRPPQRMAEAARVFDYAIFVQCVTPACQHDYFNKLGGMQILFA